MHSFLRYAGVLATLFSFLATSRADLTIDQSCKTALNGGDATARINTAFQDAKNYALAPYLRLHLVYYGDTSLSADETARMNRLLAAYFTGPTDSHYHSVLNNVLSEDTILPVGGWHNKEMSADIEPLEL